MNDTARPEEEDGPTVELRDLLNVIRARRWTIINAALIVAVTAFVLSIRQPSVYQGEARVLISERDTGAALFGAVLPEFSSQPERGLQTQVQLMRLRPLAETAIRELDLQMGPDALLGRVEVAALGQTNIVVVRARAGDPEEAAAIANAMAEGFVEWSQASKREALGAAAEEVEGRLNSLRSEIVELGEKAEREGKSEELASELQLAAGTYATLAEKLEQLRINEALEEGSGRVVSKALVSTAPVSPKPVRDAALGLAVGLVFGLGMAFLNEYLDDTIKSTEEMERVVGAPVLGLIPSEKGGKAAPRQVSVTRHPGSIVAEAYRVLRGSLDFVNFEHEIKTVLITSAVPSEGKSTVASNLAASLAQAGAKVALVCCDFRRPTTEQFFEIPNVVGLSDVLTGRHTVKAALQRPGDENLLVMTAGRMPPNPAELLGSDKMRQVIESLEEWADWVILDSPPLLAVADATSLGRTVDGVLLVSKAGTSTRGMVSKARETLDKVGARTIGTVVWGLEEADGAGGYGYYRGYYGTTYYTQYYGLPAQQAPAQKRKRRKSSNAAVEPDASSLDVEWAPPIAPGRRIAGFLGKVMVGFLGFLLVVVLLVGIAYALDVYMGLDLAALLLRW